MRRHQRSAQNRGQRAVVIGGGIAGLASAALLARDGHTVTLLEGQDAIGGRAGTWQHEGFRFDTGPSWYLMPEVFDHFFTLFGTSAAEQLDLTTLDPGYRVFFEPSTPGQAASRLDIARSRSANQAAFEAVETGAGEALGRYLDSSAMTYRSAKKHFLYTSWQRLTPLLRPGVLRDIRRLPGLMTQTLEAFVGARFADRRLRQVLGYPAVFLGTSPERTPALYHLMSHLDLDDGVRYPQGGFTAVIAAIERVAREAGVTIVTDRRAISIDTRGGRRQGSGFARRRRAQATGVTTVDHTGRRRRHLAEIVVSAADLHHTETELLPSHLRTYPSSWWQRRDPGPGAVLAMLGVRGGLPQLEHHSLFFTADWKTNFDTIFADRCGVPDPASCYVCRPSATDASVAPNGCENLFVLIPVAADTRIGAGGVDGAGAPAVEAAVDRAIAQISEWADIPDLAERIVVRRTVAPADFARDLNAWQGGALGPAHTLRQSALLRARNASRKVAGLYYAGTSSIPGVGLPMCLISAEIMLKRVRGDTSLGPLTEGAQKATAGGDR
ncbi:phytoene desaturase family protein [Pseudoclavibacter sp. 13-3]|uniref:phytoene desaturase family protein n=1 Tax=Pseudoclavibacter sp. 13-3 TaxID=2901228 RepID=UPI001E4E5773|nr:phytoene desaturase family protein [Pseudoclavibacter sp. 13-3]MCD7101046.1 phytoene desaturase [Pseudoclavibacter sp. 13-3]